MTAGLSAFRIVVVEPLYSGNIGSICRAMANMACNDLVLVAPRIVDGWAEGERMAVHAGDLLRGRRDVATLEDAVGDCSAVVGATARLGLYRQHVRTPRELAPELHALAARGRVALLFGREDNGLSNEEIARCTHLLRIPTGNDYISLNLAQAVMICCYELFTARGDYEAPQEKSPPVEAGQRQRLLDLWRETMLMIGFMNEEKADHMMHGFQRIFSRGVRTADDAHILMGAARQSQWAAAADPDQVRKAQAKGQRHAPESAG